MRSTSPPAGRPGPPKEQPVQPSILEDLLVIDGVTDLAVYRMLTGRFDYETNDPEPAELPGHDGQLPLFVVAVPGGGEECDRAIGSTGNAS